MPIDIFGYLNTGSVYRVSTTDSSGKEFTHIIEPELAGISIPRNARLSSAALMWRRVLWNAWLLIAIVIIVGARRDYDMWNVLLKHGVITQAKTIDGFDIDPGETEYAFNDVVFATKSRGEPELVVTFLPNTTGDIWQIGYVSDARRDEQMRLWILSLIGVCSLFGAGMGTCEYQWRNQLRFLREGIVVHGLVRSGEIVESGNLTFYYVDYSYWTGEKTQKKRISVTGDEYRRMTYGNPYFTLLYDAANPKRSIPYSRITAARLVAAPG